MKELSAKAAAEEIAQLSDQRVRDRDLYLTPRRMFSTDRLKLNIVQNGQRFDIVRVASSYLFAHLSAASAVVFVVTIVIFAESAETGEVIGIGLCSLTVAGCFYGHTGWVNRTAARENPIISYQRRSGRLKIASTGTIINRREVGPMLALASTRMNAHKPESNHGELKLLYHSGGRPGSVVLVTHHNGWMPRFDQQILPFVEELKLPYFHVERNIGSGEFSVDRVV